jgi:hypothetical protein
MEALPPGGGVSPRRCRPSGGRPRGASTRRRIGRVVRLCSASVPPLRAIDLVGELVRGAGPLAGHQAAVAPRRCRGRTGRTPNHPRQRDRRWGPSGRGPTVEGSAGSTIVCCGPGANPGPLCVRGSSVRPGSYRRAHDDPPPVDNRHAPWSPRPAPPPRDWPTLWLPAHVGAPSSTSSRPSSRAAACPRRPQAAKPPLICMRELRRDRGARGGRSVCGC